MAHGETFQMMAGGVLKVWMITWPTHACGKAWLVSLPSTTAFMAKQLSYRRTLYTKTHIG